MGNLLKLNNSFWLLFVIFISIALAGCRITGGSRGHAKSSGTTKTSYITGEKSAPIILGVDTPRVRFKIENYTQFGSYKKNSVIWKTSMSMSVLQKQSDVALYVTVYKSDGTTVVSAKRKIAFIPAPSSKSRFISHFYINIHPANLSQYSICNTSKNGCNKNFVVEMQLADGQSEQNMKLDAKSKISVSTKCATWVFCKKPKEIETIKTGINITKIM